MGDYYSESLDEMHAFYGNSNPTKEEQFWFEEAMEYLSQVTPEGGHPEAFDYNLAMHFMDIKNLLWQRNIWK